ncbi:hypothetical protein V8C86DRAFT_2581695 [Haematococcus lacustris]
MHQNLPAGEAHSQVGRVRGKDLKGIRAVSLEGCGGRGRHQLHAPPHKLRAGGGQGAQRRGAAVQQPVLRLVRLHLRDHYLDAQHHLLLHQLQLEGPGETSEVHSHAPRHLAGQQHLHQVGPWPWQRSDQAVLHTAPGHGPKLHHTGTAGACLHLLECPERSTSTSTSTSRRCAALHAAGRQGELHWWLLRGPHCQHLPGACVAQQLHEPRARQLGRGEAELEAGEKLAFSGGCQGVDSGQAVRRNHGQAPGKEAH